MAVTLRKSSIQHAKYAEFHSRWQMVRDVVEGKEAIDDQDEVYLPKPKGRSDDEYDAYQTRAVLYNATSRTLAGYLGAIFRKQPDIDLPDNVKYLEEDFDGEGNNIIQFSKAATSDVIGLGRYGMLVDFPDARHVKTLADEKEQNVRAYIKAYCPESIVNWSVKRVGARNVLSHVLIEEKIQDVQGHVFERDEIIQYRLLELDDDGYYVIYIMLEQEVDVKGGTEKRIVEVDRIEPRLPGGKRLDFIPFVFVGSLNSSPDPNIPPLYDLAQLNIAHYRNSADFEEAVFLVGQPTPWINNLSQKFIDEYQNSLKIGSRTAWLLPEGCQVGLLESSSDKNLILEAMRLKENEMIGIGARLIQDTANRGSESTESVQLRRSGEASTLACIADNVSDAMVKVINWASMWMGNKTPSSKFKLNKDFFSARLSANDIRELVAAWQSGAVPLDVVLDNLRKGEVISELLDNETVKGMIESEEPALGMIEDDRIESGNPFRTNQSGGDRAD